MEKETKGSYVMKSILKMFVIVFAIAVIPASADDSTAVNEEEKITDTGYRIDVPGTITFTVGVKIKGKVEKPQVVIFLPKEKSFYREMSFSYSFEKEISKPLPFIPIIE